MHLNDLDPQNSLCLDIYTVISVIICSSCSSSSLTFYHLYLILGHICCYQCLHFHQHHLCFLFVCLFLFHLSNCFYWNKFLRKCFFHRHEINQREEPLLSSLQLLQISRSDLSYEHINLVLKYCLSGNHSVSVQCKTLCTQTYRIGPRLW